MTSDEREWAAALAKFGGVTLCFWIIKDPRDHAETS